MSNLSESTRREGKADTKKRSGRRRPSDAERRHKGAADRRYYRRRRRGCGVTAYLESPEVKKALEKRLRPLGLTVSQAICQLLTAVAEGRLSLSPVHPAHDVQTYDPGDLADEFRALEAAEYRRTSPPRWTDGRGRR